ncbi:uncharacterized protein KNAG_0J02430 [Huiozyma naganishii CBS 8797]|uniref:Anoctamin transmembrane domain-containing protein n=1 Tax=Huiozyma naganishii (strain ATCC MYA-139 / BCRC 22969 / CBS 8797 / KCTC 17520 / NBRC 10181 / NCYC 3082 / Yp74L-3) TaxID=1071383 RepID=J7S2Z2_HUIN7|nr:hypothetical protein KNAG_0J02430 [Kazachstania naganishii CBS 8797]CCK72322.1 hypothetical protein KNAG_0J02430 [Kazachstania naganishii CBS 8797]
MARDLEELDPNCVLVFQNTPENETQVVAALEHIDLDTIVKVGNENTSKYAFLRIDCMIEYAALCKVLRQSLHLVVNKCIPLYDNDRTRKLDTLGMRLNKGMFSFPIPKDFELANFAHLTKNPTQALYFAFCTHYEKYLRFLAIVGTIVHFVGSTSKPAEFNKFYSVVLNVWSVTFVTSWVYSKQGYYAKLFGKTVVSLPPVGDFSSPRAVLKRKLLSVPVSVLFVLILVAFQFLCFGLEIFSTQIYTGPFKSILSLVPTVSMIVFVPLLTRIYNTFFVERFIRFENSAYPAHSRTEKNFALTFCATYMPLLITLFVYLPLGHLFTNGVKNKISKCGVPVISNVFTINTKRHQKQLFFFVFPNQVILYATDHIIPVLLKKYVGKKSSKGTKEVDAELTIKNEHPREYRYWQRAKMFDTQITEEFDVESAFKKTVLQFGFIAMFSNIWPLAPLVLLLVNRLVLKSDMIKALKKSRPATVPFDDDSDAQCAGHTVTLAGIRPWDDILKIIAWFGVIVCSTSMFMYRYCYLPGVGKTTLLDSHAAWFIRNPLARSWSSIFFFAVAIEHITLIVFIILKKYFKDYEQETVGYGIVPDSPQKPDATVIVPMDIEKHDFETVPMDKTIKESSTTGHDINISSEVNELTQRGQPQPSHEQESQLSKKDGPLDETEKPSEQVRTPSNEESKPKNKNISKISEYNGNFATSSSSVAGATVPTIIPTSKNYSKRFNADGTAVMQSRTSFANSASVGKEDSSVPEGSGSMVETEQSGAAVAESVTEPALASKAVSTNSQSVTDKPAVAVTAPQTSVTNGTTRSLKSSPFIDIDSAESDSGPVSTRGPDDDDEVPGARGKSTQAHSKRHTVMGVPAPSIPLPHHHHHHHHDAQQQQQEAGTNGSMASMHTSNSSTSMRPDKKHKKGLLHKLKKKL